MLQKDDLTYNQRNILTVTYERKKEIYKLVEFSEYMVDLLRMEPTKAIQVIENRKDDSWTDYLKTDLLPLLQQDVK